MPHVIESTVSLESSVLTFLCDAYDEPLFLGLPRQVLRFHRKLAPYKASFSASSSSMCACTSVVEQDMHRLPEVQLMFTSHLTNSLTHSLTVCSILIILFW
jgi:glycyl-tRNA synthetase (class II)